MMSTDAMLFESHDQSIDGRGHSPGAGKAHRTRRVPAPCFSLPAPGDSPLDDASRLGPGHVLLALGLKDRRLRREEQGRLERR